jgi:hypothetical protein
MTIEDLREYAEISKYTLDDDNIKQLQLMHDATQSYAVAEEARSLAKLEAEELYARLDAELRAGAAERNEKMSETQIKMQIALNPEMMEAERRLIARERTRNDWSGAVKTIEARGYSMTNMGNLYQANYFSRESSGKAREYQKDDRAERARSLRPQRRGSWES